MERVRVHPHISIDGITAATYGSIRVGAELPVVLDHLDRFRAAARRRGTTVSLVFCVLPDNLHELPELLLFAERRDLSVVTSVVREPAHHCVALLPASELERLVGVLEAHDDHLRSTLHRNLATWITELERLRGWRDAAASGTGGGWDREGATLLMFRRDGQGPVDVDAVRSGLRARAELGGLAEARITSDGRVRDGHDVATLFGVAPEQLEGAPLATLQPRIRRYEVVVQGADHYEARAQLDTGPVVLVVVPERDERGRADRLRLWAAHIEGTGATCDG
jgi:hypothetical protein